MTSPSKAKAVYEAQLSMEEGCIVAAKANIQYMTSRGMPASKSTPKMKIMIHFGTVFHPGSQLIVRLPPSTSMEEEEEEEEGDNDSSSTPKKREILTCVIGRNNLFEETCRVIIDLGARKNSKAASSSDNNDTIRIIGDYNRFAPKCQVQAGFIGSGNAFEASCHVKCSSSGSGSDDHLVEGIVAAPHVRWNHRGGNSTSTSIAPFVVQDEKTKEEHNTGWKDVVLFQLNGDVHMREHIDGKERNVRALEAMLPAMRVVVRRYHKLMEGAS